MNENIRWNPNEWLAPSHVETPKKNLVQDIANFVIPNFTEQNLGQYEQGSTNLLKIIVLAERLEFIDHLEKIALQLERSKSINIHTDVDNSGKVKVIEEEKNLINGHDFAGIGYDIDALSIYLLLTCIDTIQTQPKYLDVFAWLEKENKDICKENIKTIENDYKEIYGVTLLFKKAFTKDCSENLRKKNSREFCSC